MEGISGFCRILPGGYLMGYVGAAAPSGKYFPVQAD